MTGRVRTMAISVSVIIPTKNRDRLLNSCLTSIVNQVFPPDTFEVLVVDDGRSALTSSLVSRFAATTAISLTYISGDRRRPGPAAARNLAVKESKGNVLAFTDDDCLPDPLWLAKGTAALQTASAASGKVVVPLPETPSDYQKNSAKLSDSFFVTANCFCRRQDFCDVGGFDEDFRLAWREDTDLLFKLLKKGCLVVKADEAIVYHPVRLAPFGISLYQQRKTQYNALLYKKHPELYRIGLNEKPPILYYGIASSLVTSLAFSAIDLRELALPLAAIWLILTIFFCLRRLTGTLHTPSHILEMLITSCFIPPLSLFWRGYGSLKYRVVFL